MAFLCSGPLRAADDYHLPLRNHNPFLQIHGLPAFQSATLTSPGHRDARVSLDIANHSDAGIGDRETAMLDGETYTANLSWRYGWSERVELGVDVPIVSHNRGILDGPIAQWHDLFGLSNANRAGRDNQLLLAYDGVGQAGFNLDSAATAPGDIQLSLAYALTGSPAGSVTLRASLKVPTGDERKLTGSGAADFALGLYATDSSLFSRANLSASAFTGILLLGDSDVLQGIQKDSVGYAGVVASWELDDRFALSTQLYGQSAYYDSNIDEIGGSSVQVAVGGTFQPRGSRLRYSLGIIEDLFSDATTDVAFQFSIRLLAE